MSTWSSRGGDGGSERQATTTTYEDSSEVAEDVTVAEVCSPMTVKNEKSLDDMGRDALVEQVHDEHGRGDEENTALQVGIDPVRASSSMSCNGRDNRESL